MIETCAQPNTFAMCIWKWGVGPPICGILMGTQFGNMMIDRRIWGKLILRQTHVGVTNHSVQCWFGLDFPGFPGISWVLSNQHRMQSQAFDS